MDNHALVQVTPSRMNDLQHPLAASKASKHRAIFWLGGAAVMVSVPLAIWLARTSLAELGLQQFCRSRGLACQAKIAELTPGSVGLSKLRIAEPGATSAPLEIDGLGLKLRWQGFTPVPVAVQVDKPVLRLGLELDAAGGTTLNLRGLQKLMGPPGQTPPPQPELDVRDARIELDTPAGLVVGSVALRGQWPSGVDAEARFPATRLQQFGANLELNEAEFTVEGLTSDSARNVSGVLDIEKLEWGSWSLRKAELSARLGVTDGKGSLTVDAGFGPVAITQANVSFMADGGELQVAADLPATMDGLSFGKVSGYRFNAIAERPTASLPAADPATDAINLSARSINLNASGLRDSAQAGLLWRGTMDLEVEAAELRGTGAVGAAGYTADTILAYGDDGLDVRLDGAARADGLALDQSLTERLVAGLPKVSRQAPFASALDGARTGIAGALKGFDLTLPLRVALAPGGELVLGVSGAVRLDARNGLILRARPVTGGPVLAYREGRASGNLSLDVSGGGLPVIGLAGRLAATSREQSFAGEVSLTSTATADDRLKIRATNLEVQLGAGGTNARAALEVDVDTAMSGARITGLKLSGPVRLEQAEGALRIGFPEEGCIAASATTVRHADFLLRNTAARICPTRVPLFEAGVFGAQVATRLDGFRIAAENQQSGLRAVLSRGEVDFGWRQVGDAFDVAVRSPRFDVTYPGGPFAVAADSLTFKGEQGRGYELALANASAVGDGLPVRLGGGALNIPMRLRPRLELENGQFSGVIGDAPPPERAPSGDMFTPLPRFEPLRFGGTISLEGDTLSVAGTPSLVRGGYRLGQVSIEHSLKANTGSLTMTGEPLTFARGALQPTSISGLLRGLFTNAVGRLTPNVSFGWSKAGLKSSGRVVLEGLGFSTERAGRIDGVNGVIELTELLDPKTPPGQTLLIDKIDPGLPFFGGVLKFQLLGQGQINIERASFPFAGGELLVTPTVWQPGGEEARLTIEAKRLLGPEIAALVNAGKLRLTGVLSGTIPAVLTRTGVRIENAWLEAETPGGVLKFEHEGTEAAGNADPGAKLAFDALRDLRFSLMRLGLNGDLAGEMTLTFLIEGKNPAIYGGQPIRMNMTLTSQLMGLINQASLATSGSAAVERVRGLLRENGAAIRSPPVARPPLQSPASTGDARSRP